MPDSLVKARWNGPFAAEIVLDGVLTTISPGDEHEVSKDDLLSSHWEPVGTEAKKAEKAVEKAAAEQDVE